MAGNYYTELPDLEGYYLEESWILSVEDGSDFVVFELSAVLTPKHPLYHDPRPHEYYCYEPARLAFENADTITWKSREMRPAFNADGSVDYNNIDVFTVVGCTFTLEGTWGSVEIQGGTVSIEVHDAETEAGA